MGVILNVQLSDIEPDKQNFLEIVHNQVRRRDRLWHHIHQIICLFNSFFMEKVFYAIWYVMYGCKIIEIEFI